MSLANEVLGRWAPIMRDVALETGTKGRFDVTLDGELIFSNADAGRHAEPGEIVGLLEKKLGPALHWRKDSTQELALAELEHNPKNNRMRAIQRTGDNFLRMGFVSRGFRGRKRDAASSSRVPPGQYVVTDFPVLSAGPTPRLNLDQWTFSIEGEIDEPKKWTWKEFQALPSETVTKDIHCVTKWTKLDTTWKGVAVDALMEGVETAAEFTTVFCDGGYTTNLTLDDITGNKAWVVYEFDGQPIHPEHGGPVRFFVPHLYFWKSAKWVRGIRLQKDEHPGFWESNGYHLRGDPWLEQRYWGD